MQAFDNGYLYNPEGDLSDSQTFDNLEIHFRLLYLHISSFRAMPQNRYKV